MPLQATNVPMRTEARIDKGKINVSDSYCHPEGVETSRAAAIATVQSAEAVAAVDSDCAALPNPAAVPGGSQGCCDHDGRNSVGRNQAGCGTAAAVEVAARST